MENALEPVCRLVSGKWPSLSCCKTHACLVTICGGTHVNRGWQCALKRPYVTRSPWLHVNSVYVRLSHCEPWKVHIDILALCTLAWLDYITSICRVMWCATSNMETNIWEEVTMYRTKTSWTMLWEYGFEASVDTFWGVEFNGECIGTGLQAW